MYYYHMPQRKINTELLLPELQFTTARSSGPGGQHANKVETKVQVRFNVHTSQILSEKEKQAIYSKYAKQLTIIGELLVTCEEKRSQLKNKEIALKKLNKLLEKAFEKPKKRKPTSPSKTAKLKRLKGKKILSDKKSLRGKVGPSDF
jgi:ribosome-associated protein